MGIWIVLAVALAIGYFAFRRWRVGRRGMYIHRDHPLILEAARKTQASLDTLRRVHETYGEEVAVKFRMRAADGEAELPWAALLSLGPSEFTARIVTPLVVTETPADGVVTLPLDQLLDWQAELTDGSIRGGFTTQAEIRVAKQAGVRVPAYIARMEGRFADR